MELKSIYEIRSLEFSGQEIRARIAFDKSHKVFEGHFPGSPIVPGVVQVQIIKDLMENVLHEKLFLNKAKNIKFLNVISPLEINNVWFEIVIEQQTDSVYKVKCVVKTETKVFMKYSGSAMIVSK